MIPAGYRLKQITRQSEHRGGGVAMIHKEALDVTMVNTIPTSNFEYMETTIGVNHKLIRLLIIYRPPPSPENGFKTTTFLQEFENFLGKYSIETGELLLTGDFNLHMEITTNTYTNRFKELLDSGNLVQHVMIPTHIKGHTLDLVISRDVHTISIIHDIESHEFPLLDHLAISFMVAVQKPAIQTKEINFRKYKSINLETFMQDIKMSELVTNPKEDLEEQVDQYNHELSRILDKHAPIQKKKIILRPQSPWFTDDLRAEKQKRRKFERKWRKSHSETDRSAYKKQCAFVSTQITEAKTRYYSDLVKNNSDQKQLFQIIDSILHKNNEHPLPKHSSPVELANRFGNYFDEKIRTIRSALETANANKPAAQESVPQTICSTKLTTFEPVSEDELRKIIMHAATKTCALDPIPTWLVKESLDVLLPSITSIVNKSLLSGMVPPSMKLAIVIPLLKKMLLDPEILKNFRPISNLSFLSKIMEKTVSIKTLEHTKVNHLDAKFQSAYKAYHSTETALLRVQNDFLMAADEQKVGILVLLDLSAAFDVIDHDKMLSNLQVIHGIEGTALEWYRSYLSDRYQTVVINGVQSESKKLSCGVPQGSILGPEMFTKYTRPLTAIIDKYGIKYHMYADDTQVYIFFETEHTNKALQDLELCISDIRNWMQTNLLKLNDSKTEVVVIGSKQQLAKMPEMKINIGNDDIPTTQSARNIGVIFDEHLDMKRHVISICKSANFHLYNIRRIRKYLTREACEQMIHAFVSTKLDYANSLLYGIPEYLLYKLQKVQNTAARIVCQLTKYHHITGVLKDLHWLPIRQRIVFKILMITYKALNDKAPKYISELLTLHVPTRKLRSGDKMLLVEPRTNLKSYGDRSFEKVAPQLWNRLPYDIKTSASLESFKTKLKLYLFKQAFK